MLLVFGGSDRLQWEFEEKFVVRYRQQLAALPQVYDVHTVDRANHVFSLPEWQRDMLRASAAWLRKCFPHDVLPATTAEAIESRGARS